MAKPIILSEKTGDILPFFPTQSSRKLETLYMELGEFLKIPEIFCQRDTISRAKRAKHLAEFKIEHIEVTIGILERDDEKYGKIYRKGYTCVLDGNTRRYMWQKGKTDILPDYVSATVYRFDSLDDMRRSYDTFDSKYATEKTAEKVYGVLRNTLGYEPKSEKVKRGSFDTALKKACFFYYPEKLNQTSGKVVDELLEWRVVEFVEEIKVIDGLITKAHHWDATLFCLALMSLRKWGLHEERLLEGLRRIDRRGLDTTNAEWDGITHIVNEWMLNKLFKPKVTSWKDLGKQVSFCCYWMDKWMTQKTQSQLGANWDKIAKKWKDEIKTPSLPGLYSIPI